MSETACRRVMMERTLAILGTRGIPARHGGFETFAERLAVYLVEHGWTVTVYCQSEGASSSVVCDTWNGVRRMILPIRQSGPMGTMIFDYRCIRHVATDRPSVALTLGYNTAMFDVWLRLNHVVNIINMDGIEWMRAKWGLPQRLWLRLNERAGCWLGNHLVADHPCIASRLARFTGSTKVTMIPYGADSATQHPDVDADVLQQYGLRPRGYVLVVARPEPENSILEIVEAFSVLTRNYKLVVLGKFEAPKNAYHAKVLSSAGVGVMFPGPIYDTQIVRCLRANARLYVHGHSVGGTNPSLVEAMGAGCAILARDNEFNRWVAGSGAAYFCNARECRDALTVLLDNEPKLAEMRLRSRERHAQEFGWPVVLRSYDRLLARWASLGKDNR